jgi:hypothetical protein
MEEENWRDEKILHYRVVNILRTEVLYSSEALTNIPNYRLTSLLNESSKIYKYIILMQALNSGSTFVNKTCDFRKYLSSNKATYKLIHKILQALNNKSNGPGISCDLAKASECVN